MMALTNQTTGILLQSTVNTPRTRKLASRVNVMRQNEGLTSNQIFPFPTISTERILLRAPTPSPLFVFLSKPFLVKRNLRYKKKPALIALELKAGQKATIACWHAAQGDGSPWIIATKKKHSNFMPSA